MSYGGQELQMQNYTNYPPQQQNYAPQGYPTQQGYPAQNYATAAPSYPAAAAPYTGGPLTAAPPSHQTMIDGNQVRLAIIPQNGSSETLLYAAYATKKTPCCHCLPWDKVAFNAFQKATYVKVYDNKIEFNEPSVSCVPKLDSCCCCNFCNGNVYIADDIRVIYYDRHIIQRVDVAGCCTPLCTHNNPCIGDAIVLRPPEPPCCAGCCSCACKCGHCCEFDVHDGGVNTSTSRVVCNLSQFITIFAVCAKPHRLITHIDNPQGLVDAINRAKAASHVKYTPVIPADQQKPLI